MSDSSKDIIKPPWIEYPGTEPWWGGWRQGYSEAWFHDIWIPFWDQMTSKEKKEYLKKYPPPDEDWYLCLTEYWK
jgi:hypothetical protein